MNHDHTGHNHSEQQDHLKPEPFYKAMTAGAWVSLALIVGAILFYLLTYHKKHLLDALPYILIAGMMFMHIGGHGGHNHEGKNHG